MGSGALGGGGQRRELPLLGRYGYSTLAKYEHQIAGSRRMLTVQEGRCLLKPTTALEEAFYRGLGRGLVGLVPRCLGLAEVERDGAEEEPQEGEADPSEADRQPLGPDEVLRSASSSGWRGSKPFFGPGVHLRRCLVLENLTAGMSLPCIMDVKVGASEVYPEADEAKARRKVAKSRGSTIHAIGLRLCMRQLWDGRRQRYRTFRTKEGPRALGEERMVEEIRRFWCPQEGWSREAGFAEALEAGLSFLAARSAGWRLFTASALLVLDAAEPDPLGREAALGLRFRLIDFAHSQPAPPHAPYAHLPDLPFLFGLRNLARIARRQPLARLPVSRTHSRDSLPHAPTSTHSLPNTQHSLNETQRSSLHH